VVKRPALPAVIRISNTGLASDEQPRPAIVLLVAREHLGVIGDQRLE